MDEYGATIKYIVGKSNVIADQFLRMPRSDDQASPAVGKKSATPADNGNIATESDPLNNHHKWVDDIKEIVDYYECLVEEDSFLNLPSDMDEDNPLNMETIKEQQAIDALLQKQVKKYPER